MPPKLRLALDSMLPKESAVPVTVRDSMQCTDNGTLRVMSKSLQEYKFNAEGMTRCNPRLLEGDQPYKVHLPCHLVDACIHGSVLCAKQSLHITLKLAVRSDLHHMHCRYHRRMCRY